MKTVALLGVALFMLTSLVVGSRLAWRYLCTRKLPELLMAIALLCTGLLAFAVGTLAKILLGETPSLRSTLTLVGLSIEYVGVAAMALFAWRVFHAKKPWAAVAIVSLAVVAVGAFLGELLSGEYLRYSDSRLSTGPWIPFGLAARSLAPTWLAFECLRFHAQLRKRLSIGLADPLVVRRVLCWGVAMSASSLAYGFSIVHRLVYGTGLRAHLWALCFVSALAMTSAVAVWVAFFSSSARGASSSLPPSG